MKILILFLSLSLPIHSFAGAAGEVLGDTAKGAVVGGVVGGATTKIGQDLLEKNEATKGLSKKLGEFFDTPPGILTMSGIATVYSGMLYNAAAQQEQDAEDNIKKIDRVLAEFKDSYVAFCPGGREDLKVPECYCYLAKGGPNPDRTKSQICQALWAKNQYMNKAVAGDYRGISKFVDPVGCVTVSGQFDENCKCKKFLDSKGNNACQKSATIALPGGIAGAMMSSTGLKDIMQLSANASNGNPMFKNFSTGQLALKAVATDALRNQLISKLAQGSSGKGQGGLPRLNEQNIEGFTKALVGEKNFAALAASGGSPLSNMSSTPTDPKIANELKAAAAKAGIDLMGNSKGLLNKKIENKNAFAFNLGGEAGASGAAQTQDFPEQPKNYKIGGDISKQKDTNLFDIISNRYIQSGLKRLFDEQ